MGFRNRIVRISQLVADSIVGATFATAASGKRWVITSGSDPTLPNLILGYSGGAHELSPAELATIYTVSPGADQAGVGLQSPQMIIGDIPAILTLVANQAAGTVATLDADSILIGHNGGTVDLPGQATVEGTFTALKLAVPHAEFTLAQQQTAANGSVPNSTATLMRWTSTTQADGTGTITNPNTAVNGDGRIVLTQAGLYRIVCNFTFGSNATGQRSLSLLLNAGATVIGYDSNDGTSALGTPVKVELERRFAAGDYFTTSLFQSSGTNPLGQFSAAEGYNHMQVTRLGA